MNNQLKLLICETIVTTTIGEICLKPFKFKQFPVALDILNRYVELFNSDFESNASIAQAFLAKAQENYLVLNDITQLIFLVTGKSATEIEELQYDEIVSILTEVIEMNMDFFDRIAQRVMKVEPAQVQDNLKTGELESAA